MAAMYRRRCRAVRRVCARPNRTALGRHVVGRRVSASALALDRYRFQGREWSSATGLVNFRARWYDPVTGRWLSKDPIGLSGGLNLYAFCGNDPIGFRDPFGWKKKKQKDEDNHKKENSIFDSNVVKVPTELVKTTMPEGALDVIKMSTMSAAVTAAKSVVQGAEAVPDVVAVKSARGGISQIENMTDPSGATLSSEDGMKALENLEQSIRSNLRNFNNLK